MHIIINHIRTRYMYTCTLYSYYIYYTYANKLQETYIILYYSVRTKLKRTLQY